MRVIVVKPAAKKKSKVAKKPVEQPAPAVETPQTETHTHAEASVHVEPPQSEAPQENAPNSKEEENLEAALEEAPAEEAPIAKTNKLLFTVGTIVATALVTSSIGIFLVYLSHPTQVTRQETAPVEEVSPSATPVPALAKSDITLEVLNGSGVKGSAGKAASKLLDLGYTVVGTGNADARYDRSEVFVAAALGEQGRTMLLGDLAKEFSVSSVSGVLEDSTVSARLIIGKE